MKDIMKIEGNYSQSIESSRHINLCKTFLIFVLIAILGICIGAVILYAGGLQYEWVSAFVAAGCSFIFVIAMGSLRRFLEALLIFSFSMSLDVHLMFSDRYTDIHYGIPITLTGVTVLCLYIIWAWRLYQKTDRVNFFPLVSIPFVLLVFWSGFSFLWAAKPNYVFYRLWGMVEMLFLYLYAANNLKTSTDLKFLVKCISVTVIITAIVAICQYATGSSFGLKFLGGRESQLLIEYKGISRVSGFLVSSNSLAWFLNLWLPLLLLWGIAGTQTKFYSMYLISFLLGLLALVMTYSRGGWVSFVFSLILIVMWLIKKRSCKIFRGALVRFFMLSIIATMFALPFSPLILERLTSDDYGAAYSRIPLAKVAINMIRYNPVRGVGFGNYEYAMHAYDNTSEHITMHFPASVHNIYLMLAAELGIGALVLFVYISIFIFWQGLRAVKSIDKTVVLFLIGILVGLAAFYLQGMIEPGGIGFWKFRPFWFMVGTVLSCSKIQEDK